MSSNPFPPIAIVRTGAANLASVVAAFDRLEVEARIVDSPVDMESRDVLVVPGVGSFATGMNALTRCGWTEMITERFACNRPTLAICLGMQLLCQSSDESPGVAGIGLIPTRVERLPQSVSVPQLGWNRVQSRSEYFDDGHMYYANSHCIVDSDCLQRQGWEVATSVHGIEFVAAARQGNLLVCQFHPELSGGLGQRLLRRWLDSISNKPNWVDESVGGLSC